MKLILSRLSTLTRGIYKVNGIDGLMPPRALALHPLAARTFAELESLTGGLVYSDILRSPAESLYASETKHGVQPPGYSGHNFGFSVDVAVDDTMKRLGLNYEALLILLARHGWYCHRRDHVDGEEGWHFNYFGDRAAYYLVRADPKEPKTWAEPVAQLMVDTYGPQFVLSAVELQTALQQLRLYHGEIDGDIGPLTRAGLRAFQRAWHLTETGSDDGWTQRVLATVTATVEWT